MAAVTICSDFGAQEIKSVTVAIVFQSICYEVMGPGVIILVFWILSQWSIELVNWTDQPNIELNTTII